MLRPSDFVISFLLLWAFASCVGSSPSTPAAVSDASVRYDMGIRINDVVYDGVAAIAAGAESYQFHIKSKVELDRFIIRSCQREVVIDSAWNVEETAGWFIFKHKIDKKNEIKFEYRPSWIEKKDCPLSFLAISKSATVSSGFVAFHSPGFTLPAVLSCNGVETLSAGGSHCQSKVDLEQSISFRESVILDPSAECEIGSKEGKYFQFKIKKVDCAYLFKAQNGSIHQLITHGYEQAFAK